MKRITTTPWTGRSLALNASLCAALLYFILPLFWLVIAATKTDKELQTTFGLWFGTDFNLVQNVTNTFTLNDGVYLQWIGNTAWYSAVSAVGAAVVSTAAGYALAKFSFPGRNSLLAAILLSVAVPITVLVLPIFLILSQFGLINTPLALILPSMLSPFGVYLMWIFASENLPTELLEAARIDGAGEIGVLRRVAAPLLSPGFVTVLLFSFVATWNNYFLPLLVFSNERLYPLAVGLAAWNDSAGRGGTFVGYPVVITGALIAVVPLIVAFIFLQRYWQSGLTVGGVKG